MSERDRILRKPVALAQGVQRRRTSRVLAISTKAGPPQIGAEEAKAMKRNPDPSVDTPSGRAPRRRIRRLGRIGCRRRCGRTLAGLPIRHVASLSGVRAFYRVPGARAVLFMGLAPDAAAPDSLGIAFHQVARMQGVALAKRGVLGYRRQARERAIVVEPCEPSGSHRGRAGRA